MFKLTIVLLSLLLTTSTATAQLSLGWEYAYRLSDSLSVVNSMINVSGSNTLDWETRLSWVPGQIQLASAQIGTSWAGMEQRLSWGYALPQFEGKMSIVGGNVQTKQDYSYTVTTKEGSWTARGVVAWGVAPNVNRILAGQMILAADPWQFLLTGSTNQLVYPAKNQHIYVLEAKYAKNAFTWEAAVGAITTFDPAWALAGGAGYTSEPLTLRLNYRKIDGTFITPAKSSFALGRGRTGWDGQGQLSLGWFGVLEVAGTDLTNEAGKRQLDRWIAWSTSLGLCTLRVGRAWTDSATTSEVRSSYGLYGADHEVTLTKSSVGWQSKGQFSIGPLVIKATHDSSLMAMRIQGDLQLDPTMRLRGLVRRRKKDEETTQQCFVSMSKEFDHFTVELDWGIWDMGRVDAYWQYPSSLGLRMIYQRKW